MSNQLSLKEIERILKKLFKEDLYPKKAAEWYVGNSKRSIY